MKRTVFNSFLSIMLKGMIGIQANAHAMEVENSDDVTIYPKSASRIRKKLFLLFLLLSMATVHSMAYDALINYLYYDLYSKNNNEGFAYVVGTSLDAQGSNVQLEIPASFSLNNKTYTVVRIGDNAFEGCTRLTSITIPNSIEGIGSYAFKGCTGLTSISIPKSVEYFGVNPFAECSNLSSITVDPENPYYDSRNYCNAIIDDNNNLIAGCKNTTIPDEVTHIVEAAFMGCTGLSSITIPANCYQIGEKAFMGCTGLTSITFPGEASSFYISEDAFNGCSGLTSVTLYNIISIGARAFYGCSNLATVISRYTPRNTNTLETLGDDAFTGISDACVLKLSVGKKDDYIAKGCTTDIFKGGIEEYAIEFYSTLIKNVCVNNWDTNHDGELSVAEAAAVTSIFTKFRNVGGSTNSFNEFQYFTGVTSIPDYAFQNCNLSSIIIPKNVTSIGNNVFGNCGMRSLIIPQKVTSIGGPLFSINYLENLAVEAGNEVYDSRNNCNAIIETSSNKLILGCAKTIIPKGVVAINDKAFYRNHSFMLTSITIPSSVTSIGNYAFSSNDYLKSIFIYAPSVPTCGTGAFDNNIYVLSDMVDTYKSTWAAYSNKILPITLTAHESISGSGEYWSTYYNSDVNVTLPSGTTIYKAKINDDKDQVILTSVSGSIIKAGQAVVLKSSTGSIELASADGDGLGDYTDNELRGVDVRTVRSDVISSISGAAEIYVMSTSNGFGFHKYTGEYVPANEAFLALDAQMAARAQAYDMVIDEEESGIKDMSSSDISIDPISAVTYNGSAQTPDVTVKDGSTTPVSYSNNTNAGTATVTVTGMGNYTGTKTANFTINAKNASNLTISSIAAVTYNGSAQTPTVTVKDGSTTLTSGTHYTVSYSNNTNAGTATVTVTGKGNYTGTKTANFTINKVLLTVTANSYTVERGDVMPTYEIQYSGFVNNETASVLTTAPTASCTATTASVSGTYDIIVSGGVATNYNFKYNNGTLTIYESLSLTDGTAFVNAAPRTVDNLTYTRNYRNTNWQALYVPFSMSYDDWKDDFDIGRIIAYYPYYDENGTMTKADLLMTYVTSGTLKPNHPYFIKAKTTGEKTISLTNATLYASEENSVDCSTVEAKCTFTGTYSPVQNSEYYVMGGGKLGSLGNGTLSAMRWYMTIENRGSQFITPPPSSISLRVVSEEDATAILQTINDQRASTVYDLYGRTYDKLPTQRGVYIINGKKVMIK